jgi:hypothetical protein
MKTLIILLITLLPLLSFSQDTNNPIHFRSDWKDLQAIWQMDSSQTLEIVNYNKTVLEEDSSGNMKITDTLAALKILLMCVRNEFNQQRKYSYVTPEWQLGYAIMDYKIDTIHWFNNEDNRDIILNAIKKSKIDFFNLIFGVQYRGEEKEYELETGGYVYHFTVSTKYKVKE